MYDVIVVGGGPAGSAAARRLTKAGKKVLILEKKSLPRVKPCGGGVPAPVFQLFDLDFSSVSSVIDTWIRNIEFRLRDSYVVHAQLPPETVAMVQREQFDSFLLDHSGAEIVQDFQVVSLEEEDGRIEVKGKDGSRYEAEYVLLACGGKENAFSGYFGDDVAVRKKHAIAVVDRIYQTYPANQPPSSGDQRAAETAAAAAAADETDTVSATAPAQAPAADTAVFEFGRVPGGYIWMFPKSDHISVGAGMFRGGNCDLSKVVRTALKAKGFRASKVEGLQFKGSPVLLPAKGRRLIKGKVLRIGESAGIVDPLSGEGIRYAVLSGIYAADSILENNVADYGRRVWKDLLSDLKWGKFLSYLLYGIPKTAFLLGVRNYRIFNSMVEVLAGKSSYRRAVLLLPINLFTGLLYSFYFKNRR